MQITMKEVEMSEVEQVKVAGPILPPPPVPSQVRLSAVPAPAPILQEDGTEEKVEGEQEVPGLVFAPEPNELDAEPKGTITIRLYHNIPYVVSFEGKIAGDEITIAWRAMMKQYRVWKAELAKEGGVNV